MRRDLTKALKALGERHAKVAKDGSAILVSPNDRQTRLQASVVSKMVSEGLAERVRSDLVRTDAGRAFLRRSLATMPDDAFMEQHQVPVSRTITDRGVPHRVVTNAAESPLAWLATRKDKSGAALVTSEQLEAGKRLAMDWDRARVSVRTTQSWDPSGVRGEARRDGLTVSEAAQDARRRVTRALDVIGPGLADVLLAVCCDEQGLEAVEKRLGWPARSAKVVLKLALDRLVAHYGIGSTAKGSSCSRTLHWGTEDYCPSV